MTTWLDTNSWPWQPSFYDTTEGKLHYVDTGEGPPVLFSHGTPTWSYDWRHLIRRLHPTHRCIAVDHLGFGLSERPSVGYRPEDHAMRFAEFADSLDVQDATVVIHDFGGPIALRWVLDNIDRVSRVVILNTWAWPLNDNPTIAWGSWLFGTALGKWLYGTVNVSLNVLAPSAVASRASWDAVKDHYHPVFPDYTSRTTTLWPLAAALTQSADFYAGLERDLSRLAGVEVDVIWGLSDTALSTKLRDR
ncbi:MAG: alpha/beta fold hydrolase, partial [Myxococcota bacterium]